MVECPMLSFSEVNICGFVGVFFKNIVVYNYTDIIIMLTCSCKHYSGSITAY